MRCDICAVSDEPPRGRGQPAAVLRFSLVMTHGRTTRGAGAVQLCMACWTRYAKPRMRKAEQARKLRESNARLAKVGAVLE